MSLGSVSRFLMLLLVCLATNVAWAQTWTEKFSFGTNGGFTGVTSSTGSASVSNGNITLTLNTVESTKTTYHNKMNPNGAITATSSSNAVINKITIKMLESEDKNGNYHSENDPLMRTFEFAPGDYRFISINKYFTCERIENGLKLVVNYKPGTEGDASKNNIYVYYADVECYNPTSNSNYAITSRIEGDGNKKVYYDERANYSKNNPYTGDMLLVRLTPSILGDGNTSYDSWRGNSDYEIYYTTDDSDPRQAKFDNNGYPVAPVFKYDGSLRVINSMTVRAAVRYKKNFETSTNTNNFSQVFYFDFNHMSTVAEVEGKQLTAGKEMKLYDDDKTTLLLIATYGTPGDFNPKLSEEDGKVTMTEDKLWRDVTSETASSSNFSQIAGFESFSMGNKDATGENKWDYVQERYADYQYKYDGELDHDKLNTFDIPNSGSYIMFEPEVDGELTVVVRQTGLIGQEEKDNVLSDLKKFVKRYTFVCDETGAPMKVQASMSTNATLENRAFAWTMKEKKEDGADNNYYLLKDGYPVEQTVKNEKTGEYEKKVVETLSLSASEQKLYDAMYALYKKLWDDDIDYFRVRYEDGYAGKSIEQMKPTLSNMWESYREQLVSFDVSNLASGKVLVKSEGTCRLPNVLVNDEYGWYTLGKGTVIYTFPVKAGKTYFMMGRWTKIAPCGYIFRRTYKSANGETWEQHMAERVLDIDGEHQPGDPDYNPLPTTVDKQGKLLDDESYRIHFDRKFRKNVWTSLVVPFSMSPTTVKKYFGNATQIMHFNRVDSDNKLYLTKHYHQMIVAGTPILIKPADNENDKSTTTEFNLKGQNLDIVYEPNEENIWEMDGRSPTPVKDTEHTGWYITGSYKPATVPEYSYIMGYNKETQENNLRRIIGGDMKVAGTRAWILHPDNVKEANSTPASIAAFVINGVEDTATTIEDLFFGDIPATVKGKQLNGVYNMNGQQVRNTTDTTGLPAGIYIAGGKKVVVK